MYKKKLKKRREEVKKNELEGKRSKINFEMNSADRIMEQEKYYKKKDREDLF